MAIELPIYQVDAFTAQVFGGNPAAVVPLQSWLQDRVLQQIAAENNLSETAFLVPEGDGYELRWFTPAIEVELCGHATLAAAYVVFRFLQPGLRRVVFRTRMAGTLTVANVEGRLSMDFPSRPPKPSRAPDGLADALGARPAEMLENGKLLCVFESDEEVLRITPDFQHLGRIPADGVIVTAPGTDGIDFVSRFFAPWFGIDEDPVTGSAHCLLVPYWARRLGKTRLEARQVSRRGGSLTCEDRGDRVAIIGDAQLYLTGTIHLGDADAS